VVKKFSPAAADFSETMVLVDFPDADISCDIPAAVRADWRVTQHTDISVLFSAIQKPPVMGLVAPISPIVTVSLVGQHGINIELSDLLEPSWSLSQFKSLFRALTCALVKCRHTVTRTHACTGTKQLCNTVRMAAQPSTRILQSVSMSRVDAIN